MSSRAEDSSQSIFSAWDPEVSLRSFSAESFALAEGFLQTNFRVWFPGFSQHWLPLTHSLGIDLRLQSIVAQIGAVEGDQVGFVGSLDDEPIGLCCDRNVLERVVEQVLPRTSHVGADVFLEYMTRRFFKSLSACWSGPDDSVIRFEPELSINTIRPYAHVRLVFLVNGMQVPVSLLLGRMVTQRLDSLSKKETKASRKTSTERHRYWIEVAQLAVPASAIADYTNSSALIDLEVPTSQRVLLYSEHRKALPAELCVSEGRFALRFKESGAVDPPALPDGSIRLRIAFGTLLLAPEEEKGQILTELPANDEILLVVGEEIVANGKLGVYQGRFAVQVA